ncbi:MAG: hypothetical protein WC747_01925 [Candidatus Babeliales bacterium]|jgi:hypothetical protein
MEEWKHWHPLEEVSGKFYVDGLMMLEDGLIIKLSKGEQKIEILFDGCIDTYRYTNDSFSFKIISDLNKKYGIEFYGDWSFFKVSNSEYLSWLSEKSCEYSKEFPFMHFCVIGYDEIIDVIVRYEPKVRFIE